MTQFIQYLLGYPPVELADARFAFGASVNAAVIIGGLAAVVAVVWILYRKTTTAAAGRLKIALIALRSAALVIIFLCLLQPMLTTSMPVPQQSDLAVIVDNSRSMTIRDMAGGRSRGEAAINYLFGENGLADRIRKDFHLQTFKIDSGSRPISGPQDLAFSAVRTSLAEGLQHVSQDLKGLPVSGVILITDGGDNSGEDPVGMARILASYDIPVYTVGLGQNVIAKDREIIQVTAARTVMEGSIFDVNATVRSRGYDDQEFEIIIEAGNRTVASKKVKPDQDGATRRYTLELTSEDESAQVYVVRIPHEEGEVITQNNRSAFLVNKERKRAQILYIEGHPRNEYKFIRRAVKDDESLRLVTYLKTGPQKFLRQGIESPQELDGGYPAKKEDLYKYDAVIFGDVPKNFFSADQLALTREFVSQRGGGFLMLGGSTALEEGFIDSPIAEILPVKLLREAQLPPQLEGARLGQNPGAEKFSLQLTPEGEQAAMLRLGLPGEISRQLWQKMPQLQGINVTGQAKPGATVLAVHPSLSYGNQPLPVIAYQRYGRGRTMVIATAATWRWQMLLPHEDMSYERLWRQVLRWLAASASSRVELSLDKVSYAPGEVVKLRAGVFDAAYTPVDNATVWLKVTDPAGTIRDVQLEWAIEEEGIYVGAFNVHEEGVHKIEVTASTPSGDTSQASTQFLAAEPNAEFINAGMDAVLLEKIARAGGGKFYTDKNADRLVADLKRLQKFATVKIQRDIWDGPLILLVLFGLFGLEWWLRRRKGMS
jgi:uncharacterized membrane protein